MGNGDSSFLKFIENVFSFCSFNTSNFNQPVIIPVANYVKFRPISLDEFILIENSIKNSEFKIKKTEYND